MKNRQGNVPDGSRSHPFSADHRQPPCLLERRYQMSNGPGAMAFKGALSPLLGDSPPGPVARRASQFLPSVVAGDATSRSVTRRARHGSRRPHSLKSGSVNASIPVTARTPAASPTIVARRAGSSRPVAIRTGFGCLGLKSAFIGKLRTGPGKGVHVPDGEKPGAGHECDIVPNGAFVRIGKLLPMGKTATSSDFVGVNPFIPSSSSINSWIASPEDADSLDLAADGECRGCALCADGIATTSPKKAMSRCFILLAGLWESSW